MEVMLMLVLAGLDIMSSSVECVWRRGAGSGFAFSQPTPPSYSCHRLASYH